MSVRAPPVSLGPLQVLAALRRRLAVLLPLAVLAAALVIGLNEAAYRESVRSLDHLGDRGHARLQIQALLRRLIELETGQRGYLLTGRAEYLQPVDGARADVDGAVAWLERYYSSDAEAAPVVREITTRAGQKVSEVQTTIELHAQGRAEAARELVMTNIGLDQMRALRELADRLHGLETRRVEHDRSRIYETLRINRVGVHTLAALSLVALALFLRQSARLQDAQRGHAEALLNERDQLEAEVTRRTAELAELAAHLQTAREDEKSRLARELHDELGALLTAAKLDAARLRRLLGPLSPEAEARLKHLNDTINDGIGLKRRIIEDLRPSSLANLGLVAALEIQAREFAQRAELQLETRLEPVDLADSCQMTAYRLVQESLTNIAKYAQARRVTVAMREEQGRAHLTVEDDGRGFDLRRTPRSAHGLMGMRYRVQAEGGEMRVRSAPGQGTRIDAWLPLDAGDAAPAPDAASPPGTPLAASGAASGLPPPPTAQDAA